MSTFDSDDLGTKGYFLPEDSQFRLKKLREYVQFLSHLAEPRAADEEVDWSGPEIRASEVAICLELLEEQIAQVLGELSWPAERRDRTTASEAKAEFEAEPKVAAAAEAAGKDDAESELAGSTTNEAGERYVSGVTLGQIDELARLGDILRAHGDVVVAIDQADFAYVTLSIMGDAILRDAERLRDIVRDIDAEQRLAPAHGTKPGVREERAAYLALSACSPSHGASYAVRQHPTYQ